MSNRAKIHFQDDDFIRKNSLQCNLFLQVTENVCRILIVDQEENIRLIEEHPLEQFLKKEWPFINLKFAGITVTFLPDTFIFIPKEFVGIDQEATIASFLDSDSQVLSAEIKSTTINTYFTINEKALELQNLLGETKIIPSSNLLIQQILLIASDNVDTIGINFHKESIEFAIVKNAQFVFYNCFPKENADDFNYYLLSVLEQFGIQIAYAQFYLAGDIQHQDENYERLSKYSSHIHFLADIHQKKLSPRLESSFSSKFFLLSELSKCEF